MSAEESLDTLARALDAQTRRADALAGKFHERGCRIAELEQEAGRLRAEIVVLRTDLRLTLGDLQRIGKAAADRLAVTGKAVLPS